MKLLVIEQEVFIDPHGSADETKACNKFVLESEHFLKMNGMYSQFQMDDFDFTHCVKKGYDIDDYLKDAGIFKEDSELYPSEDGYNSNYFYYSVREITDEEYTNFKEVINHYNKIK